MSELESKRRELESKQREFESKQRKLKHSKYSLDALQEEKSLYSATEVPHKLRVDIKVAEEEINALHIKIRTTQEDIEALQAEIAELELDNSPEYLLKNPRKRVKLKGIGYNNSSESNENFSKVMLVRKLFKKYNHALGRGVFITLVISYGSAFIFAIYLRVSSGEGSFWEVAAIVAAFGGMLFLLLLLLFFTSINQVMLFSLKRKIMKINLSCNEIDLLQQETGKHKLAPFLESLKNKAQSSV